MAIRVNARIPGRRLRAARLARGSDRQPPAANGESVAETIMQDMLVLAVDRSRQPRRRQYHARQHRDVRRHVEAGATLTVATGDRHPPGAALAARTRKNGYRAVQAV